MDGNQTKESFSDSIIKYCVDKSVDFFAKHWIKILILIALLAIENNRRFLGFAVGYVTGSIKVDTDDVTTLLQVIPIVLVSYLAYKTNERINKLQEQEIKDRAKKQKEEEKRKKDIFFQQYQTAEMDYYNSLSEIKDDIGNINGLSNEITKLFESSEEYDPKIESETLRDIYELCIGNLEKDVLKFNDIINQYTKICILKKDSRESEIFKLKCLRIGVNRWLKELKKDKLFMKESIKTISLTNKIEDSNLELRRNQHERLSAGCCEIISKLSKEMERLDNLK